MLSRVADCLYWMSRYLERAEHTARLLDVNLHRMLDQTHESSERRWERVLASLLAPPIEDVPNDAYHITHALTCDAAYGPSITACIGAARENARQVREALNTEQWEQINRLYLQVRQTSMEAIWNGEPHRYFTAIKEGAQLFHGISDATMNHDEGWQFIQVGRFVERASATAALLDVHAGAFYDAPSLDYLEWVGLLKSCTAFEAYCKVYTANVQPPRIAEFLLLNAASPRSILFSAARVQDALQAIARSTGSTMAGRAERVAGRMRAGLEYARIEELLAGDLQVYLRGILDQCIEVHAALHQDYIDDHLPIVAPAAATHLLEAGWPGAGVDLGAQYAGAQQ